MDPRYLTLAQNLCRYSMKLQKGDKLLFDAIEIPEEMTVALIRTAREYGADVWVRTHQNRVQREILRGATSRQFALSKKWEMAQMKEMTAYCAIRGFKNLFELEDVSNEQNKLAGKYLEKVVDYRVAHTKWVILRWPTPAMAQAAKMSIESFEDKYFNVCNMDYYRMEPGARALETLMKQTDQVHIKGPGDTNLRFSIKNIGAEACIGKLNIPDGEVYSCPVRDSVEGVVHYNTPTTFPTEGGKAYSNIRLEFKKGKIVNASCDGGDNKELNKVFDSDKGARYLGEFALGFNPYITEASGDILFDEKIAGSLHLTPGQCYDECPNGNKSQIHWDLVLIQRPEYGGGEIWFDGKLIRKDGLFIPKALQKLNPDYLMGSVKKKTSQTGLTVG